MGWFGEQGSRRDCCAAVVPEAAPTLEEQVAEHHAQAALARGEGRLAEPAGDNALDHYLAILALAHLRTKPLAMAFHAVVRDLVCACRGSAAHRLARGRSRSARSRSGAPIPRAVDSRFSMPNSRVRWRRWRRLGGVRRRGVASPAAVRRPSSRARSSLATARLRRGQLLARAAKCARVPRSCGAARSHRSSRSGAAGGPRCGADGDGATRRRFRRRVGNDSRSPKPGGRRRTALLAALERDVSCRARAEMISGV